MGKRLSVPYEVSPQNMLELLEEIKKRPSIAEEELAKRVTPFKTSKSIAIEFNLITQTEGGGMVLTDLGKRIAWENFDDKRKEIIINEIVFSYPPYELVLSKFVKTSGDIIISDYVKKIWVQDQNIVLSMKKLNSAVATYLRFLEYVGFGNFYVGRRGKDTRLVIIPDGKELISKKLDEYFLKSNDPESLKGEADQKTSAIAPIKQEIDSNLPNREWKHTQETPPTTPKDDRSGMREGWIKLETDFFYFTIEKNPESWKLFEAMLENLKNRLDLTKDKNQNDEEKAV